MRLVDIGRDEVVEVSRLLSLPHHLLAVAPLVVEMIVCGIVPCDHDMDWAPPVSTHLIQYVCVECLFTGCEYVSAYVQW